MTGGVMSPDSGGNMVEFYCGCSVTWQLMGDADSRLMMEGEIKAIRITPPPLAVIRDVNKERWLVALTELTRVLQDRCTCTGLPSPEMDRDCPFHGENAGPPHLGAEVFPSTTQEGRVVTAEEVAAIESEED